MCQAVIPCSQHREGVVKVAETRRVFTQDEVAHIEEGDQLRACIFDGLSFYGKSLKECEFEECSFEGANFMTVRLNAATFRSCNLTGLKMAGASLFSTTFERSKLL